MRQTCSNVQPQLCKNGTMVLQIVAHLYQAGTTPPFFDRIISAIQWRTCALEYVAEGRECKVVNHSTLYGSLMNQSSSLLQSGVPLMA